MTDHICVTPAESYFCVECGADTREPWGPFNIPVPGFLPIEDWMALKQEHNRLCEECQELLDSTDIIVEGVAVEEPEDD